MIGRVLKDKYKIYDEVGAGGFSTVYLGRNTDTNEIVAIKVLSKQFTREPRYVERFRREAGLAERLKHPNVVRILDHGIVDDLHFLVMEFVEGLTLDRLLQRQGTLSIEEAVSYTEQTCAGLQAAYQAGVVHRDIKPANLMITPDGTVKIMDFGIARMESLVGLTQSGMFMGTPRYISPEMARGAGADTRSDLYALGLLAYEMLTGKPPFDAENPWAVLRAQIEAEAQPIRYRRADVPAWLEAIVFRAIAKDPAERFQTPAEMLAALQQHTTSPTQVPPPAPPAPLAEATVVAEPQRRRGPARVLGFGLLGATLLAAAAALIGFGVLGLGTGTKTPTPTATQAMSQVPTEAPTPVPFDTPVVIVVTNTPTDTPIPDPTLTHTSTPRPTDTPVPTDTPSPAPTLMPTDTPTSVPTNTPVLEPTATSGPANTPRPTDTPTIPPTATPPPITGRIAYSVDGTLHIVDAATGQDRVSPLGRMHQPDFRRDGGEILANGEGDPAAVVNINANTGAILREQTEFTDDFHPFWSHDGSRFAYDSLHHGLGQYTMLYTQGVTSSRPEPELTLGYKGQQIQGHSPVWTHEDTIVFTGCDYWPDGSGGSKCGLYRIPSWGDSRPVLIHPGNTNMRATDNHGSQLVFMSQETGNWEVFVMPNQGGTPRNISDSPGSQDGLGTFSPDGRMVAFVSNRGGGWAVWAARVDGSGLTRLFNLPGQPTSPWYDDSISWGP
jgi:serine/threonine-protein kinase